MKLIPFLTEEEHFHRLRLRIYDPILEDSELFIESLLLNSIPSPASFRNNLCHEVGGSANNLLNYTKAPLRDKYDIWLDRAALTQYDVNRAHKDLA